MVDLLEKNMDSIMDEVLKKTFLLKNEDLNIATFSTIEADRPMTATITEVTDEDIENEVDANKRIILDGIVKINLAVSSLSEDATTKDKASKCLEMLTRHVNTCVTDNEDSSKSSLSLLYRAILPSLLSNFIQTASSWSPVSPQLEMLRIILTKCGHVAGYFPRTIVAILTSLCSQTSDPATRLSSLMILSRLLLNTAETIDSQGKNLLW